MKKTIDILPFPQDIFSRPVRQKLLAPKTFVLKSYSRTGLPAANSSGAETTEEATSKKRQPPSHKYDEHWRSIDPALEVLEEGFNYQGQYFSLLSDLPHEARIRLVKKNPKS